MPSTHRCRADGGNTTCWRLRVADLLGHAARFALALTLMCCVGIGVGSSQEFSWLGLVGPPGQYRWSDGSNWLGDAAPPASGANDLTLLFDGTPPGLHAVNDFADKMALNKLHFGSTAASYVIDSRTGSELLTFVLDGGTLPLVWNDSSSAIEVRHPLSFESGLEIGGTGTGSLAFQGPTLGRGALTKSGTGTATLDNSAADLQLERLAVTGGLLNIIGGTQLFATATNPSIVSTVTGGGAIHIDGVGSKLVATFNSALDAPTTGSISVTGGGRLETVSPHSIMRWGRTGAGRSVLVDGVGSAWHHTSSVGNHFFEINGAATTVTISGGGDFSSTKTVLLGNGARLVINGGTATLPALRSFSGSEGPGAIQISDGTSGTSAITIHDPQVDGEIFDYDDVISDASGGPGSVTLLDGEQAFNNLANSYSGGTRLLGGNLYVPGNGALGTGGVHLNGGALIFGGGNLERTLSFGPQGGKLGGDVIVNQSLNLTAPLSIVGSGTVRFTAANAYDSLFLEGTLELTNDADATVVGELTGNGGRLRKFGDGVLTLSKAVPANRPGSGAHVAVHEGAIRITEPLALGASILDVVRDQPLVFDWGPTPATVSLRGIVGSKTLDIGPHSLLLNENGSSSLVDFTGTIAGAGSVTLRRGGRLMGTNAYTGGTYLQDGELTLVPSRTTGNITAIGPKGPSGRRLYLQQDVDGAYAGNISGGLQVFKTGAGMLTMTGSDNSEASYEILAGGLAMQAGPSGNFVAAGSVTALHAGATFRALSDGTLFNFWFLQDSTLDTNGHRVEIGEVLFGATLNQTIATKTGAGVLSVDNAVAHTVHVDEGMLELTGTFDVANTKIANGASLIGIATGLSQVVLESGGVIAPGLNAQPVGVISAESLHWDDGGVLQFDLAAADATDRIALSGVLDKVGGGAEGYRFDFSVANSVEAGFYQLLTFAETDFVVSDFEYSGLPAGAVGEFELQSNALYLSLTVQPGDYDLSGIVDAADYTLWRDTLGQSGPDLAADGNGNGSIDADDYQIWKSHFGQIAGGGARTLANAVVPEPASLALLFAVALQLALGRRRKA